jgi:dihydrofolate synthase/folylpolyglutamate synthase
MTHTEALRWLDSLESLGIQPGLERITALLARLGDPHLDQPSVLVAGTNGKGSVVALLASILTEAGVHAGVYTSPHLVRFEEPSGSAAFRSRRRAGGADHRGFDGG